MRIAKDGAYAVRRLRSIGFHPIFRIEGAADHLDPEDWISVACECGIPLTKVSHTVQSANTTRFHDRGTPNHSNRAQERVHHSSALEQLSTINWNCFVVRSE